jgi:hypothetical protein
LSGKVVSTAEERFYFNNNQLVRWIDQDKKQVEASNSDYAAKQAEYLDFSSHFLSAARSKTRTLEAWN